MSLDHNSEIAGDIPDLMVLLTAIRGARDLSKQILPASAEGAEQ